MRFHLPALPGQPVTRANSSCAFTQKVRGFANMMVERGHEVVVYATGDEHDHPGEHVNVWPGIELPPWQTDLWTEINEMAAPAIRERWQEGDFLGVIGGMCQQHLAELVGQEPIEWGIGYGGVFAPYKVFESYAWMHAVYAGMMGTCSADGAFFDAVIPASFDPTEAPFVKKEDYVAYCGRIIMRKGVQIASEAAERAGVELRMAGGDGDDLPPYGEYLGKIGPDERWELISKARALLVPTRYIEPFAQVHVEAMLCGTPVISTDWGVFTETITPGVNGYRCRMLREFVEAIELVDNLDPVLIRELAVKRFSQAVVAPQYEDFFERVREVQQGAGWYAESAHVS